MSGLSHCVFLILTLIFPPFVLLWVVCAVSEGNRRKRKEARSREEELALLRDIANQTRRNK